MEQLEIYPLLANKSSGWELNKLNPIIITLHQFENAVASMTAMIYWAGAHMYSEDYHVNVFIQRRQRPTMRLIPGIKIW